MDPATYEHLRNKTLLFFIEKLLDPSHGNNNNPAPGGSPTTANTTTAAAATNTPTNNSNLVMYTNKRTLHDLSCQFGSKGFTKEMRQIAGGSQSGLKKFLQSYPSIFRIDGDMVSYNVNSSILPVSPSSADNNNQEGEDDPDGVHSGSGVSASVSSIDNEAVEYFRERLMQYGIGIWVPVKSLLGHRSQAPPHIRHVSGQHIREFTNFLSKYPATFILNAQDEVLLKEFENYYHNNERLDSSDSSSLSNPPSKLLIEKKRIVELIEFYAKCLVERGPMLVEQLFCAGNLKYDDNVVVQEVGGGEEGEPGSGSSGGDMMWEYFKTPGDLSTFFKMYPQCFQVHSNLVTFSDTYKVGLEYLKRQMGVGGIIVPNNPVLFQQPVRPQQPSPAKQAAPAPQQKPKPPPEESKKTIKVSPPAPQPREQKSLLKHRVSKILMQAINQNTEHDYKHEHMVTSPTSTNPSSKNAQTRKDSLSSPLQQHVTQFAALCSSGNDTDELRAYILSRTTIVSNQRKAGQIIDEIIRANEPVSLDFEGINLGNDGQITLVQVGTGRGSVFIFDVLTQPGLIEGGERSVIGRLLCGGGEEAEEGGGGVVKVMHDCRNDSVNLYRQFGIRLRNVFDTQVAHIVIQQMSEEGSGKSERDGRDGDDDGGDQQRGNKAVGGNSKNISLNNLCSVYGTVCNPFKDKVKSVYRHDQKYWSRRPLTKQMIAYASCDVMCLVPSIHNTLRTKIEVDPARLKLFNELCEEQILTHIEPDEIRSRRRLRKNEADLRALREKLDKAFEVVGGGNNNNKDGGVVVSNSSLVLSNREMRLLKHLNLTESEKERLKLSLKVAKKLEKMSSSPRPQQNPQDNPDALQQPLSSAESTSNSELTSLEYNENMINNPIITQDPRIAQIDSLEAIINRLISDNNSNSLEDEEDGRSFDYEAERGRGAPMDFVLGSERKECSTQTISTGDIVITKVFDD